MEYSDNDAVPDDLKKFVKIYEESDSMSHIVLCLIEHEKFTKKLLMKVFGCSKYKIDQARKMKNANIGITIPVEKEIMRNRLDQKKAEHFLDFIFNSNLLQDVAYGVTKIKFDSNDVNKISRAVLTAKMSHTIAFYNEVCRSENYPPLSESSLWRILHAVKPSQQKCLAGLDDITAAAMNGLSMRLELSILVLLL